MTPANSHSFTRKINNWIAPVFMLLTVVVILLSLAGYLGKLHYYLEQIVSLKLQYLLIGLCPFIYFSLTRRKIWWIVSLFGVLINLAEILPWYIPQTGVTIANSRQPMRMFQLNVLGTNQQYDRVISLVRQEKPAIAVFQIQFTKRLMLVYLMAIDLTLASIYLSGIILFGQAIRDFDFNTPWTIPVIFAR